MADVHIHVEGLGPAGTAFALRALARGHRVTAAEPKWPDLTWPATYGVIETDVPTWADTWFNPPHHVTVRTPHPRVLPYRYRMMDKSAMLGDLLSAVHDGRLTISTHSTQDMRADVIISAHGAPSPDLALQQLAVGYVFAPCGGHSSSHTDAHLFPPVTSPGSTPQPCFMDWTPTADGEGFPPSFLYIQPVEDGLLIEETVLTTHADADSHIPELTRRLDRRLQTPELRDFAASATFVRRETVAIPMGTRQRPWHFPGHTERGAKQYFFGASGGLIHPATGYSVGASLNAVDDILNALESTRSLRHRAVAFIQRELAYLLRQVGGELIARADHRTLLDFFDCFFRMPAKRQLAYLTGHNGVEVMKTMWALRQLTGFRHPFLQPLWKNPRDLYRAIRRRVQGQRG